MRHLFQRPIPHRCSHKSGRHKLKILRPNQSHQSIDNELFISLLYFDKKILGLTCQCVTRYPVSFSFLIFPTVKLGDLVSHNGKAFVFDTKIRGKLQVFNFFEVVAGQELQKRLGGRLCDGLA